jgi:hypothetical protein
MKAKLVMLLLGGVTGVFLAPPAGAIPEHASCVGQHASMIAPIARSGFGEALSDTARAGLVGQIASSTATTPKDACPAIP